MMRNPVGLVSGDRAVSPARITWAQAQQNFPSRLIVGFERRIVLLGDMNIPEMPLQRVTGVNRIGACCMKQQSDNARSFVNAMCDREASMHDFLRRVSCTFTRSDPSALHRIYDIGARTIQDCLGLTYAGLD